MSHGDWYMLMGMGGAFILLGIISFFWGKREEKSYYNAISTRHDVREFFEHKPERPEPGALKIGGWIAMAIGLLILIIAGAFLLWG